VIAVVTASASSATPSHTKQNGLVEPKPKEGESLVEYMVFLSFEFNYCASR
jgi:hypothetical protein